MLMLQRITQKGVAKAPFMLRTLLKATPNSLLKFSMITTLNNVFKRKITLGELAFMSGKSIQVKVTDLDFEFSVSLNNEKLDVIFNSDKNDALFQATSTDLLLLMAGEADPDTLFFRRRLTLSGDTELALALKNFLDTIDLSEVFPRRIVQLLLASKSQ